MATDSGGRLFFVIPGPPFPQERPFVTRHGTFDRPRSKRAKIEIAFIAKEAVRNQGWQLSSVPMRVGLKFYGPHGASDIDNLSKLVLDACKGIIWEDDKQVVEMWAQKLKKSKTIKPETLVLIQKDTEHGK